jgi:hypothetical protein
LVVCAIVAVAVAVLTTLNPAGGTAPVADAAEVTPACAAVEPATETALMSAYRAAGTYPARQTNTAHGTPSAVTVSIPPIAFTGPGQSSTLPTGPCQTIYRFDFPRVRTPHEATAPLFKYAEVDWNTEGLPRGPQNSFVSPHFDFHFYLRPKPWVDSHLRCGSSNGRTCDPQKTSYAQMRRFLSAPPATDVPPGYFSGVESSMRTTSIASRGDTSNPHGRPGSRSPTTPPPVPSRPASPASGRTEAAGKVTPTAKVVETGPL